MKFISYVKDKIFAIFLYFLLLLFITLILYALRCNIFIILDIVLLIMITGITIFLFDYYRRKKFYDNLVNIIENIDNKSLSHEMLLEPNFLEGHILADILYDTNKYKIEEINKYKFKEKEFKEFIEMWVHEIKTPLASTALILENNPGKVSEDVKKEVGKVNDFIEQMLFYARSEAVEKDYLVKKVSLSTIVNKVIMKHKQDFLLKKITLEMDNLELLVNTDNKWMEFVIEQIINNSIKYTEDSPKIKIYAKENKEGVKLYIEDNGIGISPSDLPRVFDKGFTGTNGRMKYNSTGIGLYLVKKLCDKLDHNIKITSEKGTTVEITFPISSYINEVK